MPIIRPYSNPDIWDLTSTQGDNHRVRLFEARQ